MNTIPYKTIQDRHPNFRNEEGKLFLVRCFKCDSERGMENYAPMVSTGTCCWCGYSDPDIFEWRRRMDIEKVIETGKKRCDG